MTKTTLAGSASLQCKAESFGVLLVALSTIFPPFAAYSLALVTLFILLRL